MISALRTTKEQVITNTFLSHQEPSLLHPVNKIHPITNPDKHKKDKRHGQLQPSRTPPKNPLESGPGQGFCSPEQKRPQETKKEQK